MPSISWKASSRGEYWIDVELGGHPLEVLIDTGLIDGRGQVGFSVEESLYDGIKQAGGFQNHQMHTRLMANGQIAITESGCLDAQMVNPQTPGVVVGPKVRVYVFRGVPGVPNR